MVMQKNKEGKIVVIYDEDETLSCNAAHILTQRGFENLFMLSGGEYLTTVRDDRFHYVVTYLSCEQSFPLFSF